MEELRDILKTVGTLSKQSFDPAEYAKKRVEWANQSKGSLKGYDCKLCLNRGYIMRLDEKGAPRTVECKCMAIRRSMGRLERSGLEKLVKDSTFELYQTPHEWQRTAKLLAQSYAEKPDGHWFLAAGNAGSGKTHLCVAICRELMLRGMETRYMLWRDTVTRLKAVINEDEYKDTIDRLKSVPVLYIDDFLKAGKDQRTGQEKVTEGDINIAFELINARYNDRSLLTVISTERSVEDLLDIDQALGSRIYERSKGYILRMVGADKNWRLKRP